MSNKEMDWINEETVGCCLMSASMIVGVVLVSVGVGFLFGAQYGFLFIGASAVLLSLRLSLTMRKSRKGKETADDPR